MRKVQTESHAKLIYSLIINIKCTATTQFKLTKLQTEQDSVMTKNYYVAFDFCYVDVYDFAKNN